MIVPTRAWFGVAAALAAIALLGFVWPGALATLLVLNTLWVVALLIDAWRVSTTPWDQIAMTRETPPAFSVGRALPVRWRWQNLGPRALHLEVRESFPAPLGSGFDARRVLQLAPGAVAYEQTLLTPVARGRAREGRLFLRRRGSWGLTWQQGTRPVDWNVTVFPALQEVALRALPTQAQRRREAGLRNVRRLGEGRVFESLREWVPGDDTRIIDWKATAKRQKPMARQYEDERRQQVLIVIDAGRMLTAQSEGRARIEAVIDAALQLSYAAVEHDDNVGLMVFADEVQYFMAPARGRRALRQILEALATVEGKLVEPDYPAAFSYLALHNRKRALTVLFTDVIDRTASDALVAHVGSLRPRHLPLAVTLRNPDLDRLATARPEQVSNAFERAAAEELLQARDEALADIRSRGVLILDVPPAGAAKAVVEQYTQLKRRAAI